MLAHDAGQRRPRTALVWLPADDPETTRLLAELKRRLGPSWQDGEWDSNALRTRLGARAPVWPGAAAGVLCLALVALLLRVRRTRSKR